MSPEVYRLGYWSKRRQTADEPEPMIRPFLLTLLAGLAACAQTGAEPVTRSAGPVDAAPGSCHARGSTPAILETVTKQVQEAAQTRTRDGTVVRPASFRTLTATRIVQDRGEHWFETPCALRREDPDFIRQVQRAMAARSLYAGRIHGTYDAPTRRAVRAYQTPRGLKSGTLSMASAQALGLVALGRDGF